MVVCDIPEVTHTNMSKTKREDWEDEVLQKKRSKMMPDDAELTYQLESMSLTSRKRPAEDGPGNRSKMVRLGDYEKLLDGLKSNDPSVFIPAVKRLFKEVSVFGDKDHTYAFTNDQLLTLVNNAYVAAVKHGAMKLVQKLYKSRFESSTGEVYSLNTSSRLDSWFNLIISSATYISSNRRGAI